MPGGGTPFEIRWEKPVSEFLDQLVDSDVRYLDVQEAIELLVHSGHRDRIAIYLGDIDEFMDEMVYWHPVPSLFPEMRPLHAFWTADDDGGVTVILVSFRN